MGLFYFLTTSRFAVETDFNPVIKYSIQDACRMEEKNMKFRRLTALLLAFIMVVSSGVNGYAAENESGH